MGTNESESRKHPVNPERKYIRLQEIGLSHILAWPVALMVAAMYDLVLFMNLSFLLVLIGVACFCIGLYGRKELAQQREEQANGDDHENTP